jgi:hypothetical protein
MTSIDRNGITRLLGDFGADPSSNAFAEAQTVLDTTFTGHLETGLAHQTVVPCESHGSHGTGGTSCYRTTASHWRLCEGP